MKKAVFGLIAAVMVIVARCDGDGSDDGGGYFEAKLRGTWATHNPVYHDYSGTLAIGRDTVTITGYDQTYYGLNESQRPFGGITKGVSRKGYSEDGKIYINDFGWKEGIVYEYDEGISPDYTKLLRFTFDSRAETLRKTGE
jgi:hypothetical protein